MRYLGVFALAGALLLAGCGATTTDATGTPSAKPSATQRSTPTPTADAATALGLCEVMSERLLEYPDYVLAIANGEFDEATHAQYNTWADRVEDAAPDDAKAIVGKFLDPIRQVQAVVEEGGGSLSFSTEDYKTGNLELLEYCVDAGFKVND